MKVSGTYSWALTLLVLLSAPGVDADTVYLRNGNWVHGVVTLKSEHAIRLDIGELGHLEIPLRQIVEVETNERTGSGYAISDAWSDAGVRTAESDSSGPDTDSGADPDSPPAAESPADSGSSSEPGEAAATEATDTDPETSALPEARIRKIEGHIYNLQRQQSRYRVRAERHLKEIGADAIPYLLPLGTHTHDLVRIAVFRIFEAVGDSRAIDACIEALTDENRYVRDYAERTLRRITGRHFGHARTADPRAREAIRARWRRWWEQKQKAAGRAATQDSDPPPPAAP